MRVEEDLWRHSALSGHLLSLWQCAFAPLCEGLFGGLLATLFAERKLRCMARTREPA